MSGICLEVNIDLQTISSFEVRMEVSMNHRAVSGQWVLYFQHGRSYSVTIYNIKNKKK